MSSLNPIEQAMLNKYKEKEERSKEEYNNAFYKHPEGLRLTPSDSSGVHKVMKHGKPERIYKPRAKRDKLYISKREIIMYYEDKEFRFKNVASFLRDYGNIASRWAIDNALRDGKDIYNSKTDCNVKFKYVQI